MTRGRAPAIFSTEAYDPAERFDAWRETFALSLARVDVQTPDRSQFRARATIRQLAALRLIDFDLGPMSVMRTGELLKDGDDGFSLVICTGGAFEAFGDDGSGVRLGPGGAALLPHYAPGGTRTETDSTEVSLVIPRSALGRAIRNPDGVVARPPAGPGALGLLVGYVRSLNERAAELGDRMVMLAEGHLLDLLAQAYDPEGAWAREDPHGGGRAARLRVLLAAMAARFDDAGLTPGALASELGVSPRQVHLLLEETGVTFSAHLRELRLQAARRMLQSPRFAGIKIIEIALAAGFSDLSYFNRRFRARFGDTPQAFRPVRGSRPGD